MNQFCLIGYGCRMFPGKTTFKLKIAIVCSGHPHRKFFGMKDDLLALCSGCSEVTDKVNVGTRLFQANAGGT